MALTTRQTFRLRVPSTPGGVGFPVANIAPEDPTVMGIRCTVSERPVRVNTTTAVLTRTGEEGSPVKGNGAVFIVWGGDEILRFRVIQASDDVTEPAYLACETLGTGGR